MRLDSRGDRPLGRYFPELVELLGTQPPATYVMDGEIVMVVDGEMDFETLQLRLHPAASRVNKLAGEIPSTFVAFDLLERRRPRYPAARRRTSAVRNSSG